MSLLRMSFYGSVMILAILLLRAVFGKKLPRQTFVILWGVAVLRLLLPVSLPTSFSIYTLARNLAQNIQEKRVADEAEDDENAAWLEAYRQAVGMKTPEEGLLPETGTLLENGVWNAGEQQMSEAGSPSGKPVGSFDENFEARINGLSEKNASWRTVFERVSFAGTIVCTLAMLLGYWGCLRMFSTAVLVKWTFVQEWIATYGSGRRRVTVKQSDRISTPLTYGILHPTILLPLKNIESEEKLALILQHELVHIRRFDAATKIFMVLTLCIHWFNPLVWVLYGMMNKDMELSCDEAVLNRAGMGARKEYARTLLAMEEKRSRASALCSGFGKNAIEERVTAVMKHKKRTRAAIAAAGVLIVAISLLFATVAENKETNTGNTEQQETQLPSNENKDELPIDPPEEDSAVQDEKAKAEAEQELAMLEEKLKQEKESATTEPENSAQVGPDWMLPGMEVDAEEYSLTFMPEGMEETVPAWLVKGRGYVLLIPKEGWRMYAPDAWLYEENEQAQLWIADFEEEDREELKERFLAEGYEKDPNDDGQLRKSEDGISTVLCIKQNAKDLWGVFYTYPDEAAEGLGMRLAVMAQHVGLVPIEEEEISREQMALGKIAGEFAVTYLTKDEESMKKYLAEDVEAEAAGSDVTDFELGQIYVPRVEGELADGEKVSVSVEFRPSKEADFYMYLSIDFVKVNGEWKVAFYGLEM